MKQLILITTFSLLLGQNATESKPQTTTTGKTTTPPKRKTMEEALKNKKEIPGLFTLYQDLENGKLHMLIKEDQIDKEYIHFVHGLNGQLNAGVFKGNYRGARIFKLNRYFNRIEFEV